MGDSLNFALVVVVATAFVVFGAQVFTFAVSQGGQTADYPLINHSQQYQERSVNYTQELMNITQASQQSDPSVQFGLDIYNTGSALAKTFFFTMESMNIGFQMLTDAMFSMNVFGVPAWVFSTIIAIVSLVLLYSIINALLRWNI